MAKAGPRAVAREENRWYLGDKLGALVGCLMCFPGAILFFVGALGIGSATGSPGLLLAAGVGTLVAGVVALLFLLSRHRVMVFEDRIVLSEAIPPKSPTILFRDLKSLQLTEDRGGWECTLETLAGRKASLRLTGLDFPDEARQVLSRVAASLREQAKA